MGSLRSRYRSASAGGEGGVMIERARADVQGASGAPLTPFVARFNGFRVKYEPRTK